MLTQIEKDSVELFHRLLLTQNEFNARFPGWKTGVLENGKVVDWLRYIRKECNESTERLPYKHWAKDTDTVTELDIWQIRMEVIDILHFILSQIISYLESYQLRWEDFEEFEAIVTPEGILIPSLMMFTNLSKVIDPSEEDVDGKIMLNLIETLNENHGYYDLMKEFEVLEAMTYSGNLDGFDYLELLISICSHLEMDKNMLVKMYYGKNALNMFRNDNGYKNGTFVKLWDGVREDNDFLQDILDRLDSKEFLQPTIIDLIYGELQTAYNLNVKKIEA